MDLFNLVATIGINTGDYEKGIDEAAKKSSVAVDAISKIGLASDTSGNKLGVLTARYNKAQEDVVRLTEAFNKSASESGFASKETQRLADELADAEKKADGFKKELDAMADETKEAGEEAEKSSGKFSGFADKLKNGLATAAKVGAAAIGAATTAIGVLGKIGLDYNSQMEQYTTNFTTMLGSQEAAVQKVEELRKFAASTPLSMDDLASATQTLLAFGVESENSTAILRQLGDIALGDADKMGRLATAFGKATANGKVTGDTVQQMIDAGFNPLIQISRAAGETMEETQKRMSEGAISVAELEAAMEAVTSGTGQFAGGMEAASHTMQGMISTLKDNANALVGEVFQPVSDELANSVLPMAIESVSRISEAFQSGGLSGAMEAFGTVLSDGLNLIVEQLPVMVDAGMQLLGALGQGIVDNLPVITDAALQIVLMLSSGMIDALPELASEAVEIVTTLATGISEQLPELIPVAVDAIMQLVETLTDPGNLENLINAALQIMVALAEGLVKAVPEIIEKAPQIIKNLVTALVTEIPQITAAALQLIITLGSGLIVAIPKLVASIPQIVAAIAGGLVSGITKIKDVGGQIVKGLWEGIKNMGSWIKEKVSDFFGGIVDNVKGLLGIHSPSTVFAGIGENMALGLEKGWDHEFSFVEDTIISGVENTIDKVAGVLKSFDGIEYDPEVDYSAMMLSAKTLEEFNELAQKRSAKIAGENIDLLANGFSDNEEILKRWNDLAEETGIQTEETLSEMVKTAGDKLLKWAENAQDYGADFIDGIIAGIEENAERLYEIIRDAGKTAGEEFKNGLLGNPASFGTATVDVSASTVGRALSGTTGAGDNNLPPIVVNVYPTVDIDGKTIGETAYTYIVNRQKAYGGAY